MLNYLEIGDQTILVSDKIEVIKTNNSTKELIEAEDKLDEMNKKLEKQDNRISTLDRTNFASSSLSLLLNAMLAEAIVFGNLAVSANKPRLLTLNIVFGSMLAGGVTIRLVKHNKYKNEKVKLKQEKLDLEKEYKEILDKVFKLRKEKEVIACKKLIMDRKSNGGIDLPEPDYIPAPPKKLNEVKTLIK